MVWPVVKELLQYKLQMMGKEKGLAPLGVFPLRKFFYAVYAAKSQQKNKNYFSFKFNLLTDLCRHDFRYPVLKGLVLVL